MTGSITKALLYILTVLAESAILYGVVIAGKKKFLPFILFFALYSCNSLQKSASIPHKQDISETGVKKMMKAGDSHHYTISMEAGEYMHIKAEQYNIAVIAKVKAENVEGEEFFDYPKGEYGPAAIYLWSN